MSTKKKILIVMLAVEAIVVAVCVAFHTKKMTVCQKMLKFGKREVSLYYK